MSAELKAKLSNLAGGETRPVSTYVRHILEQFVEASEAQEATPTQEETPAIVPIRSPGLDMSKVKSGPAQTEAEIQQMNEAAAKLPANNQESPEFKAIDAERVAKSLAHMKDAQKRWADAEKKRQAAFKAMMRKMDRHLRIRVRVNKTGRTRGAKSRSSRSTRAPAPAGGSDDGPAAPPLDVVLPPAHSMPAPAGTLYFRGGVR